MPSINPFRQCMEVGRRSCGMYYYLYISCFQCIRTRFNHVSFACLIFVSYRFFVTTSIGLSRSDSYAECNRSPVIQPCIREGLQIGVLQTTSTALPFWREVSYGGGASGDDDAALPVSATLTPFPPPTSTPSPPPTVVSISSTVLTDTY